MYLEKMNRELKLRSHNDQKSLQTALLKGVETEERCCQLTVTMATKESQNVRDTNNMKNEYETK